MTSLSRVSNATRKLLEICAGIVGGLIAITLLINLFFFVKNSISPTPPAPPSVSFGKLPSQSFPQGADSHNFSYTINTLSGDLPTLPDRMTVYKFQQPAPDLLALQKVTDLVTAEKFTDPPTALSDTLYQWTKTDPLPTTLTMDIQTQDFFLTSQYQNDPAVVSAANVPSQDTAQTVSSAFFDQFLPLPSTIDSNKTKTTLLAIKQNNLQPATSLSDTQIIRIDYFYQDVNTIPLYTQNPSQSLIYTLIASSDTSYPQVVEAQLYHKNLSSEKATYPIKTARQAYEDLKQGKGFIAANPNNATSVTITDVSLGYYIDTTPQKYLWPIIVFQGDKGFYAYVSAIPDQWIKQH